MEGLPPVSSCDVGACFYNREKACHAPAINVGDKEPACDTFVADPRHHIHRAPTGLVGACHVRACRYNTELTCGATAIAVGHHAGHADCVTFEPRR